MAGHNLSETLFKPSVKHRETSTLLARVHHCLMWIWRGINPWEIEEVLSRIAASRAPPSRDDLAAARDGRR